MNLYTHAVLAQALQSTLVPADPAEYLWGAVAPDIRYLAGLRREVTHLPDEIILQWAARYPEQLSFIQGYRVHCLLDRIDTVRAVCNAFPLRWLQRLRRREFSTHKINVVIELYYQLNAPNGLSLQGSHNPILQGLGIQAEQSLDFSSALSAYLRKPSFQNATQAFTQLGIIEDARLEKYMYAYQSLRRSPFTLLTLTSSVHNARLEQIALSQVKAILR
jgi:hypothetical protein